MPLKKILNFIGFDLTWFALVYGAANALPWLGAGALLAFAIATIATSAAPRADLALVGIALVLGIALETALVQLGLFAYVAAWPLDSAAPWWMVGLWVNFALTLNHSLSFLQGRPWIAALLGALLAPFAYYMAGAAFEAATIAEPMWLSLGVLALAYALATPWLSALGVRFAAREGRAR